MVGSLNNFRNLTKLTNWLKFFLYASVVLNFSALLSDYLHYNFLIELQNGFYASPQSLANATKLDNTRQWFIGLLQIITTLLTGLLFLRWIYFSNMNAHALKADKMQFTPLSSIGWYFIPIANLWKPYQAMNEIWKCSKNPNQWTLVKTDSILRWWWFLWIFSSVAGKIAIRYAFNAHEMPDLINAVIAGVISDFINIPLDIFSILLITKIFSMQMSHQTQQTSSTYDSPRIDTL